VGVSSERKLAVADKKYDSLDENYNDFIRQVVDGCVLCGECVRNCPTFTLTSIGDQLPEDIMQKVLDFLKYGAYSEDVYLKAQSCSGCGCCADFCPQDIDPLVLHEATKIALVKKGEKPPEFTNFLVPGQKFNLFNILAALQTKPSEARWIKAVPSQPQKTETVVFLGCSPLALPHTVHAFLDILDVMGLDYVALAGGDLCCGATLGPIAGRVKESEEKARELMASVQAFSPERVITLCPECHHLFKDSFPTYMDMDFEVQFYAQFLFDNLGKLSFVKPLDRTVTFHPSCTLNRSAREPESPQKLLAAIPGLRQAYMEHGKDSPPLCCGGVANMTYPEIGLQLSQRLMEAAGKTKADDMVNVCPFCNLSLYLGTKAYPYGLTDIGVLVSEAMGGKVYEDKLAECYRCESVDELVELTRENFEANGFTEEEMRNILPLIFFPRDMQI
jgi:heterodisulfide reductase subunit D